MNSFGSYSLVYFITLSLLKQGRTLGPNDPLSFGLHQNDEDMVGACSWVLLHNTQWL